MLKPHTIFATFFLLILSITNAQAQGDSARTDKPEAPTITASASGERVRFTAPPSIVQTRLEVYDSTGKKVFDNEVRGGNVLDWRLQDGQAAPLADDTYLCAITVKSLAGKITQRIGSVTIQKGTATVRAVDPSQMTAQQSQAIGPVDENPSLSVVSGEETLTTTVVAHNGEEGQITRGRGALSFRIGDFFAAKDREQMRLTEDGNLGIGTATPQARLDVAGMIRTQGLILPDGSILTSAASIGGLPDGGVDLKGTIANLGKKKNGQVMPEAFGPISGDGTANTIAKFTGANTIANSVLTELGGNVGIGTPNPQGQLHIFGSAGADVFEGMGPDLAVGPALNFGYAGSSFGRGAGFFNVRPDALAAAPNPSLRFATANVQRMIITNTGNVGIGTLGPQQQLSVNGSLNVDQAGLNSGSFNPGITFGSFSGEGISSKRTAGGTHFGLDFYTNSTNRMSISNGGNIGIGTPSPGFKLDVADRMRVRQGGSGDAGIWFFQTTPNNDRAFVGMQGDNRVGFFGNTGADWALTMDTTTGTVFHSAGLSIDEANLGNGGINPGIAFGGTGSGEGISSKRTSGGNQFGLDLFTGFASRLSISNSGDVNISGNLAANNLPGVRFNNVRCGN
ncbi:MAG: hypothetical protein DMF60_06500, partial [Acidobacteria bacterium]